MKKLYMIGSRLLSTNNITFVLLRESDISDEEKHRNKFYHWVKPCNVKYFIQARYIGVFTEIEEAEGFMQEVLSTTWVPKDLHIVELLHLDKANEIYEIDTTKKKC